MVKETRRKKVWDEEDNAIFGNLLLIIAAILIAKWIELIIPSFTNWIFASWIFFGLGFSALIIGIQLIRRNK